MVIGIGCDIVLIKRLEKWIEKSSLLNRYFTPDEIESVCYAIHSSDKKRWYSLQKLSGFFAAKEAYMKAIGNTGIHLKDIIVRVRSNGAPYFQLEGSAKKALIARKGTYSLLSISHNGEYVVAMVVIGV